MSPYEMFASPARRHSSAPVWASSATVALTVCSMKLEPSSSRTVLLDRDRHQQQARHLGVHPRTGPESLARPADRPVGGVVGGQTAALLPGPSTYSVSPIMVNWSPVYGTLHSTGRPRGFGRSEPVTVSTAQHGHQEHRDPPDVGPARRGRAVPPAASRTRSRPARSGSCRCAARGRGRQGCAEGTPVRAHLGPPGGHPDRRPRHQHLPVLPGGGRADPPGHVGGLSRAGAGQHHHELVTGEPGHEVTASHHPIQHPGDALQHQVAAVPSVPGVDRGEADQVADADRGALAAVQHRRPRSVRAGGGWAGR